MQLPFRWASPKPRSPDSRPRLLASGAALPSGKGAMRVQKAWLLSRALYRFKHVPLGHVAAGERRAALRNLLLAWAPFDRSEYRIAWCGDGALAFAWDGVAVRELMRAAGVPEAIAVWPESMLREPMPGDGVRALECLEGIEVQVWRERSPVASRWWPQPPDAAEGQVWLRSLGPLSMEMNAVPAASRAAWLRRPWLELHSTEDLLSSSSRLERLAVGSALVGFAALTAAQAHQALSAYEERRSLQLALERTRLEAAPVIAARDRAEAMARELRSLAAQLTGVFPLELLQHLAEVLPARGVTLKEFDLSGLSLRLSLEMSADLPHSALVRQLQAGGWLTRVAEARDTSNRGWVVFEANLAQHRPSVGVARPAAVATTPPPVAVQQGAPQAPAQRP